jgi:type III secretion HrpO family protein
MPSLDGLASLGQDALLLAVFVSLPAVVVAALIGFFVAALQAATQIQDATISHLPRLLGVTLALILVGPWMGAQIVAFAARAFSGG